MLEQLSDRAFLLVPERFRNCPMIDVTIERVVQMMVAVLSHMETTMMMMMVVKMAEMLLLIVDHKRIDRMSLVRRHCRN